MMKTLFTSLAIMAFCFSPVIALAQEREENYIEVNGSAEKTVTPDRITISITIKESDWKNSSLPALEKVMKKALTTIGIDIKENLKVYDMESVFTRKGRRPQTSLSGHYLLTVKDATMAAKVLETLDNQGISNAYVSKFEYSDMDALATEVRAEAVRKAKNTATSMTEAIGQKLGPAIYIIDHSSGGNYRQPKLMMTYAANSSDSMEDESLPELDFQEIKVSASVTVRFKL
ncbi:MAG: SIMPL domain-containing protein [Alistipes sp.]|nr:SIMPL domain-containing protein [Candidatus Minthomonas equi]